MIKTVAENLYQSYLEVPDKPALVLQSPAGDEIVTYRELLHGAAAYSRAYRAEGIEPGEPVILLLQQGKALVEAFFGAILNGSIPSIMPFLTEKLSPERYRASLQALIGITEPAGLVTYPEFRSEVEQARREGDSVRALLQSNDIPSLVEPELSTLPGMRREPDDIVLLQHSSGTTGLQKGVALSHKAVLNQIMSYGDAIQMSHDDVIVSWLPLYHDMGLIAGFIMPILTRAELVLMSPFDWVKAPYRLLRSVSEYHGTLTWLPNFAYNFCSQKIRDRDLEGVDLSSWRAVINCSEPMRWESHEMFYQRFEPYGFRREALATCYAMAENVFAVTQGGIGESVLIDRVDGERLRSEGRAVPIENDEAALRMLSAGKPISNTRVRILDTEGKDLADRQIGEIALQGDSLLSGYYHRPDLTTEAFRDGWYLTGDLGYRVGDELFVTGRRKEIIIVGGKNIFPQDLEYLASQVSGVHPGRVVAFGIYNEAIGTEEIAIVAEIDQEFEEQQIEIAREIRAVVNQGSDVAVRFVETVERGWLIKTSSGKTARGANREKYRQMKGVQ
ncbi:MAG: AMP-binding protein [Anaerolineales bacterium]